MHGNNPLGGHSAPQHCQTAIRSSLPVSNAQSYSWSVQFFNFTMCFLSQPGSGTLTANAHISLTWHFEAAGVPRHGTGSSRRCLNPWKGSQPQEDKTHQPQGSSHAVTICSDFTRHYGIWGKRLVQVKCCLSALALHHTPNQLATEVNAHPHPYDDIVRARIRCRRLYPNVAR